MTKYLMMLLSVGILGIGMTTMAQEKNEPKHEPKHEPKQAPGERGEGRGPGGGMMVSPEVREANQKLRQLINEYNKEKDEKRLEAIKTQLGAIQDLQIKAIEQRVAEMKEKKDANIARDLEAIKKGEFRGMGDRDRQGGGRGQGGGGRGEGRGPRDAK